MTGVTDETAQIEPQEVWPRGAGAAAFRLLDVRAPVEVSKHGLPGACNLPILSDEERHEVGACYHQQGHDAAVALGVELTAPHRAARVAAWRAEIAAGDGPTAVTCWRGGDRSGGERTRCCGESVESAAEGCRSTSSSSAADNSAERAISPPSAQLSPPRGVFWPLDLELS